jgi:hypothetical protein
MMSNSLRILIHTHSRDPYREHLLQRAIKNHDELAIKMLIAKLPPYDRALILNALRKENI